MLVDNVLSARCFCKDYPGWIQLINLAACNDCESWPDALPSGIIYATLSIMLSCHCGTLLLTSSLQSDHGTYGLQANAAAFVDGL